MKKLLKPASIAFYLLMLVVFFIAGLYYAGLIDAGKGQGLAGGAIVLGWGVVFGGIAFIASFFIARYAPHKFIVYANIVLLAVVIIVYGITHYRYLQRENAKEESEQFNPPPTTPTPQTEPIGMVTFYKNDASHSIAIENPIEKNTEMGLGFFRPNFYEHPTLYFYGNITPGKSVSQHFPQDSLALGRDQFGDFTLVSAPPWLLPEAMNQRFGIFYFKVKALGRGFIEVEVNSKNGQTSLLDKQQGDLLFWPEFLLTANTVSFIPGKEQVPKIKPLDIAGEVNTPFVNMKVLQVTIQWIEVILHDKDYRKVGKGWIRWQKNGELVIEYTLPNL